MRWIGRLVALLLLAWLLGFAWFAALLPRPADPRTRTDVIVVPTGAPGRIARGAALLADGRAERMLITGVDRSASAASIARVGGLDRRLFATRVDIGYEASDTRSNAEETAAWLQRRRARSVRLVTTDWHLRRARFELDLLLPPGITVLDDAVRSEATLAVLLREYNKYLLRRLAALGGL